LDSEQIPGRGLYTEDARLQRTEFLERIRGVKLDFIEPVKLEADQLRGNIENQIGSLEIPLGVVGPLLFQKQEQRQEAENIYCPFATTEGALIASATRGARAYSESGGVSARVISQKMTRTPMFELRNLAEAVDFADWAVTETASLRDYIKRFSRFSDLADIKPKIFGRVVHLNFIFTTRDAAGQNMSTICTWKACQVLLEKAKKRTPFEIQNFVLDGGLSSDKKVSALSVTSGRGTEVLVEGIITKQVLENVLKVKRDSLLHLYGLSKSSRFLSGMPGWNINVANVLAAVFTATGQDIACVHESSIAELHLEAAGEDLYTCLSLPSLIVGSVGGGTRLPSQRACLELIGCFGAGHSQRLAEIIAGFALALDISTLCALVGGQFAEAHNRLGRGQSFLHSVDVNVAYFNRPDFNITNASEVITEASIARDLQITDSLVMDMSSQITQKMCGFYLYDLKVKDQISGLERSERVLLKVKPTDKEVIIASEIMAAMCGDHLVEAYRRASDFNIFSNNHLKELVVAASGFVQEYSPRVLGVVNDPTKQTFILATEYIENFQLPPGSETIWSLAEIKFALLQLRQLHQRGRKILESLSTKDAQLFKNPLFQTDNKGQLLDFLEVLAEFASKEFTALFSIEDLRTHRSWLKAFSTEIDELAQTPRTLIHHDFNPRNVALRTNSEICVLDWELSVEHSPWRDVVEFLSFALNSDSDYPTLLAMLTAYKGQDLDEGDLHSISICFREFILHRMMLYFVAHSHKECVFVARVYANARRLAQMLETKK
jgi:NADP-dependent 3-hydroxy-3-methylglutaryl-CoA reductase